MGHGRVKLGYARDQTVYRLLEVGLRLLVFLLVFGKPLAVVVGCNSLEKREYLFGFHSQIML